MNNRYLYRSKRCDNGEWVEGNRIDDGVTGQVFIHAAGNTVNESDKVGEDGCLRFVAFEVDPSTICQCTGIKDKNGKLIWENDIVNVSTNKGNTLCEVRYADNVAQFQLWQSKTLPKTSTVLNLGNYEEEVIGNIFDNPELLEK